MSEKWSLADGDNKDRYFALAHEKREEFHGWFRLHGVDETDVPLMAVVELDASANEWVIPVYLRRDGAKYIGDDGEPAQGVVRAPWKAPAPTHLLGVASS